MLITGKETAIRSVSVEISPLDVLRKLKEDLHEKLIKDLDVEKTYKRQWLVCWQGLVYYVRVTQEAHGGGHYEVDEETESVDVTEQLTPQEVETLQAIDTVLKYTRGLD